MRKQQITRNSIAVLAAFLAVCGQEVQVLTLEQPAKEEKSLLAQLAPLAEKVRQAAAEKKAAKAEEPLPAKTGKKKSR